MSFMPAVAHAQDGKPAEGTEDKSATSASASGSLTTAASTVDPPDAEDKSSSNVTEKPGKTYYFVGARYRGTIIPQAFMKLFVRGGATVYSNTVGIEVDIRKDGFSMIPSLTYTEYGTGDILFLERGKPETANNWSVVNSSMKGIYANVDLLWSTKVHKNVDIEYGVGIGLGAIFGALVNNWVYEAPNGRYKDDESGRTFNPCLAETDSPDCQKIAHSNATEAKVNGYEEKNWFDGGSKPPIFIHLAVPQLGVRLKPAKEFEARLGIGFSLTGFFFGLSANYGLEKALDKKAQPASGEQK
jgi:hypothetical protein